jgi:hypothetical protein
VSNAYRHVVILMKAAVGEFVAPIQFVDDGASTYRKCFADCNEALQKTPEARDITSFI